MSHPPEESQKSDQWGSLPLPLGYATKSLHSFLWGTLGLGSRFAHKTNNPEFIFLLKHSIFWALLDNVWKDVPEEIPILLWNIKSDHKMFLLHSVQRFLSNSNFGSYSATRENLKTSYVPQNSPKVFTVPACPLFPIPFLSPLTLCHIFSHSGPPPSTH